MHFETPASANVEPSTEALREIDEFHPSDDFDSSLNHLSEITGLKFDLTDRGSVQEQLFIWHAHTVDVLAGDVQPFLEDLTSIEIARLEARRNAVERFAEHFRLDLESPSE